MPKEPCVKCGGLHYLTQCKHFKALRVKDRLSFIQSKRLCVNCFKPGHLGRECTRPFVCNIGGCGQKHSRSLHLPPTHDADAARQRCKKNRTKEVKTQKYQRNGTLPSNHVLEAQKTACPNAAFFTLIPKLDQDETDTALENEDEINVPDPLTSFFKEDYRSLSKSELTNRY